MFEPHHAKSMLALTAAIVIVSSPAAAGPIESADGRSASMRVSHSDLDLASARGQRVFLERVRHASDELCDASNLVRYSARKRCKAEVTESAKVQLPQGFTDGQRLARR